MALQAAGKVLQQPMAARLPVFPLAGVSLFRSCTQNRSNCLCQLLCHLNSCPRVQPCLMLGIILPQKASITTLWPSSAKNCSSPEHLLCHHCGPASPGSCPRSARIAPPGIRPLIPREGCSLSPYDPQPAAQKSPGCLFGHRSEECSLFPRGGFPLPSIIPLHVHQAVQDAHAGR